MGSNSTSTTNRDHHSAKNAEDAPLVTLARGEGRIKLRIGELLDAMFMRAGHHELGFSSIEAYVVERAQQSAAWGRQARAVARHLRIKGLDRVRGALVSGHLSWSKAELLARHATPESEAGHLREALASTVRALRTRLDGVDPVRSEICEETVRNTVRVNETEIAMLEATRIVVSHLCGLEVGDEAFVEALLAEADTSLRGLSNEGERPPAIGSVDLDVLSGAIRAIESESGTRSEIVEGAETLHFEPVAAEPIPESIADIDAEIVAGAQALARRNLELGLQLEYDLAWKGYGYESLASYARERLGLSLSSVEHRRTLARAARRYPPLREAVEAGWVGYEAGLQLARVLGRDASSEDAQAWVERARRRTFKLLRQEVQVVMQTLDYMPGASRRPPGEEDIEAARDVEAQVLSGAPIRRFLARAERPQTPVTLVVPSDLGPARNVVSFRISPELLSYWTEVEAHFWALAEPGASFLGFLCTNLWQTWLPILESFDDPWKAVYQRDLHTCRSPLCRRRDVTPHHVRFRAHGGSDASTNVIALCSWCHLRGIHEGRLQATGTSDRLTWRFGRQPWLEVCGRERRTPLSAGGAAEL